MVSLTVSLLVPGLLQPRRIVWVLNSQDIRDVQKVDHERGGHEEGISILQAQVAWLYRVRFSAVSPARVNRMMVVSNCRPQPPVCLTCMCVCPQHSEQYPIGVHDTKN